MSVVWLLLGSVVPEPLGSVVPVVLVSSGGGAVSAEVQSGSARPTRSSRAVSVSELAVPRLSCLHSGVGGVEGRTGRVRRLVGMPVSARVARPTLSSWAGGQG